MSEYKPAFGIQNLIYALKVNGGFIRQYEFDNGYGASVHKAAGRIFWSIGVTKVSDGMLLENSPAFKGSIIQDCLWEEIEQWLHKIGTLPKITEQ